jgi:hypothetical protein
MGMAKRKRETEKGSGLAVVDSSARFIALAVLLG